MRVVVVIIAALLASIGAFALGAPRDWCFVSPSCAVPHPACDKTGDVWDEANQRCIRFYHVGP